MNNATQVLAAFREMTANKAISRDELHDLIKDGILAALAGRAKRLEGTLLGLRGQAAALRRAGGEEVEVPLGEIDRANLVFQWERKGKP